MKKYFIIVFLINSIHANIGNQVNTEPLQSGAERAGIYIFEGLMDLGDNE